MQLKFFTVPVMAQDADEDLNRFLRSVKILEIRRELVAFGDSAFWAICVMYLPINGTEPGSKTPSNVKGKVDYKEILSEQDFSRFSELRKIRNHIAESEAVPPYVVFTDAELADIVRQNEYTPQALRKIKGIGVSKVEKYGGRLCQMVNDLNSIAADNNENSDEATGSMF